jgi:O-antigen/teichoic acid export membrane protein
LTDVISRQPSLAFGRLRSVGGYALAMYFVRVAALLKSFLLTWYLGPSEFGYVAAFFTFLTYSSYLDLGLFHAVFRELPMLRGAGKTARIARVVDTAFGGSLLLGLLGAGLLAILALLQALEIAPGPWWLGLGLAIGVFGQLLAGVPYNTALGEGRFTPVGRALAFAAVVDLVACVGAGLAWGPGGAVLLGSLGLFVQFVLVRHVVSSKPHFRWDLAEARRLARIGIPIALIWFSNANFIAIDKVVALVGLGKESLGLYAMATAASSLAMVGPAAVATRVGPRVFERIGESSAGELAIAASKAGTHLAAKASAILLGVGLVAIPGLTQLLLPEYVPAIRAAQILLAGGAILASTFPLTTYLIGRGLQWRVVRIYVAAAVLNLAIDVVLLHLGFGITGIAVGSLISYAAFSLAVQKIVAALDTTPGAMWRLSLSFAPLVVGAIVGGLCAALLYALDLVS